MRYEGGGGEGGVMREEGVRGGGWGGGVRDYV